MTEPVYIIAAQRTPIGSYGGSLAHKTAAELGAHAAKAALIAAAIDPELIDEAITGCVLTAGAGMGIGRQIALAAGLPDETPAYTLNMVCGSGLKAAADATAHIKAGDADIVLAVGTESMSGAASILTISDRRGTKPINTTLYNEIQFNGLTDAFHRYPMGITAENIAAKYHISRQAQDSFALASQQKTAGAQRSGAFDAEISPLPELSHDEYPRNNLQIADLTRLNPIFKADGSVTAGNSSGINDGAAALILASETAVKRHGLNPLAEILSYGQAGVSPEIMGLGPVPAIAQTLERADLPLSAIDSLELNEAFAAQSLGVLHELAEQHEYDFDALAAKTNPLGGAIALGHPLGASGARILTTLTHYLIREQKNFGLASLCIGGGMGIACTIRRT